MSVIIVHQSQLGIVELAAPLDGLGDVTFFGYGSVGGVGVEGADVAGLAVYLADVLCEIPAVGVPDAVFADGEGACGGGLGGVPEDVPKTRRGVAGEVAGGDLEVASVDVALV